MAQGQLAYLDVLVGGTGYLARVAAKYDYVEQRVAHQTVAAMDAFLAANGYTNDLTQTRRHHEIYLSDVRKTAPDKLKTVIRHPIRKL